jgi:hypothetical protein
MATSKQIRISITSALNAAGIEATKEQVASMSRSVQKSMQDAAKSNRTHWADIKAAWDLGCAAIRKAWGAVQTMLQAAFKFETQTNQFKTLIGSIDEAKAHMADLKALGDTPPFSLDEFAKASRTLMVMTDGALGYKKSLEMIGDAAAATGNPIEQMGHAVGRLFATIRDGQPVARATMELRNMGVITPEVAGKLKDLQDAGATNAEVWAEVETALARYKGAMAETEKTGEGLMGAIKSRWDNIVRVFGEAFADTAKEGMTKLLEKAKELEESGTLEVWAAKVGRACRAVADAVKVAVRWGSKLVSAYRWLREQGAQAGAFWGTLAGGGSLDQASAAGTRARNELKAAYKAQDAKDAKKQEEAKKNAQERATARKAQEAQREVAEETRKKEQLAEAQVKLDKKAAEKAAAERAKLDREEATRRERARQAELAAKIKDHQKLLDAERKDESAASSAVSAADAKLKQAWGWYRDKDSMAAQLQEEKADAAAREQFEKDFTKLKDRRRDWRTAENLSVDDEAVRRVALAREEKEQAEKHLAEIEKNTADLAAKLDELLQVKG